MQADAGTSGRARSVDLREDIPHSARMYDYYLGGKDNYAADREAAEQALAVFPHLRTYARQNRAFLHRAVRYLAAEAGVRQFVDVGTGIPTSPNLHEIAQRVAPDARIVYVDNDPIVLVHARALLTGTPQGRTAYVDADLRRPDEMIAVPEFAATLDPAHPIALSLIAILHFFPDADRPADIVARLCERLPAGSFLVVSHGTAELAPQAAARVAEVYNGRGIPFQTRDRAELTALLPAGWELVEPGVEVLHRWRPEPGSDPDLIADADISAYALIARKS
ncbi:MULTISPECIES: SAM-dependent methyltransferase [Frankia]|nr:MULTISPECIES: SAM-dependent methyltransferase [Frankia]